MQDTLDMPNLAITLKQEIARIACKELRGELDGLRKAVAGHRSDLARIKRENAALEREVRRLQKALGKTAVIAAEPAEEVDRPNIRYSPERLANARAKLGLSAADFGLLLGASGLSIYKWERGTQPRAKFMPAIAAVLKMSPKQAQEKLSELKG